MGGLFSSAHSNAREEKPPESPSIHCQYNSTHPPTVLLRPLCSSASLTPIHDLFSSIVVVVESFDREEANEAHSVYLYLVVRSPEQRMDGTDGRRFLVHRLRQQKQTAERLLYFHQIITVAVPYLKLLELFTSSPIPCIYAVL